MTTTITMIRHGQTPWNAEHRWQGHAPVPLSDLGRKQAEALRDYFMTTPPSAEIIFASDLVRTVETAAIVNEHLQLPIHYDARIREIHVGEWQGLTRDQILDWDRSRYEAFLEDTFNNRRPGGESWHDLGLRVADALQDLADQYPNRHLMLVTHGGTIRQSVRQLTSVEFSQSIENTSLTTLIYDPVQQQWSVDGIAEMPHLTQELLGE